MLNDQCSLKIRIEKGHCRSGAVVMTALCEVVMQVLYKRMINYVYVYWRLESCPRGSEESDCYYGSFSSCDSYDMTLVSNRSV
jgi:hypothetical protein